MDNDTVYTFRSNVAEAFFMNCAMDLPPDSPAQLADFGIDKGGQRLHNAYNRGIRRDIITPEELDAAVCNGSALTSLVRRVDPTIPPVVTDWDLLDDLEE